MDAYKYIKELESNLSKRALTVWLEEAKQHEDYNVKIIAYNILLDIKNQNVSEKYRDDIFRNLIEYLHATREKYPNNNLYDQIIGFVYREDNERNAEIFCCGNCIGIDDEESLGRVIRQATIDKLKYQGDRYPGENVPLDRNELKQLLHELIKANKISLLRGKAPLFWVFKKNDIEICKDKGGNCNFDSSCSSVLPCNLDCVCGILGMTTGKGIRFFEINFLPNSIEGRNFIKPTVFDSQFGLGFKSVSGTWGKTINLGNIKDGVDEAIHKEHPWPTEFEIGRMGVTSQSTEFDERKMILLLNELKNEFDNR